MPTPLVMELFEVVKQLGVTMALESLADFARDRREERVHGGVVIAIAAAAHAAGDAVRRPDLAIVLAGVRRSTIGVVE